MKNKLNLGCGTKILKDYINLDYYKFKGVDVVWDVNKLPLPFKSNSFQEIIADHIIEHVDDVVKTMEELWQSLKMGA